MTSHFTSDFFTGNRNKLRQTIGSAMPIVITGNGLMQRGADEAYQMRQDSNFWYLTGINNPDLTLVMLSNETFIITPVLSFDRQAFDGVQDLDAYVTRSGVDGVLDEKQGWAKVRQAVQAASEVAVLASPPAVFKRHGLHTLPYRRRLITKLKRLNPKLTLRDVRPELSALRCVKQDSELQAIQHAIDITTQTLNKLVASMAFQQAANEYELEATLSYEFRMCGAEGHAFSPIVGAGQHAVTLHHSENNGPIAADDLIILDVGASVEHYCADITRTVSRQTLAGRKADVHKAVVAVQDFALSQLKPGVVLADYEKAVQTCMGEQLQKLGLIREATPQNIHYYFPHGTSHFLGLDTHDVGDYKALLQEGMVITCEPGIYIPEEGIGVRIEDDILITADGYKNLSASCPRMLTPVQ